MNVDLKHLAAMPVRRHGSDPANGIGAGSATDVERSAVGRARFACLLLVMMAIAGCSKPPEAMSGAASPPDGAVRPTSAGPAGSTSIDTGSFSSKHAGSPADAGIAWRYADSGDDVEAAFAEGKAAGKPLFVYWGAKWCPPCNQVKATLFNRQDFIERSRAFVAVYVDGDSAGAQKLGARFHVSGYPTMVLFNPGGVEVTRLPGEVDAVRYTQVLTLGMNADRPVKAVLHDALAGAGNLTPNDWKLLAFYAWDVDEQQVVPKADLAKTLGRLASACPPDQTETATRLRLKALIATDPKALPRHDPAAHDALSRVLASESESRAHSDLLTNYAGNLTRALTTRATAERARLLQAFDVSLKRLEADRSLARADRMQALAAQVDLAKVDVPPAPAGAAMPAVARPALPPALLADVREQTATADREITDGYERQAVITAAADLLEQAGLGAESDALLRANLAKSHSPYYLMSELAANAKKRGDRADALHWYREAFERSEGPATRLQWGASYVNALIDLSPADEAAIERATVTLFTEAASQHDAFYERSARSLQRVGTKLLGWNENGAHAAALKRLQDRLDDVCAPLDKADVQRSRCDGLLKAGTVRAS